MGIGVLFSVFAAAQTGSLVAFILTAVYAFLTIRYEDTSILDFISHACACFFRQQFFGLREEKGKEMFSFLDRIEKSLKEQGAW